MQGLVRTIVRSPTWYVPFSVPQPLKRRRTKRSDVWAGNDTAVLSVANLCCSPQSLGVLMYSVVLSHEPDETLGDLDATCAFSAGVQRVGARGIFSTCTYRHELCSLVSIPDDALQTISVTMKRQNIFISDNILGQ